MMADVMNAVKTLLQDALRTRERLCVGGPDKKACSLLGNAIEVFSEQGHWSNWITCEDLDDDVQVAQEIETARVAVAMCKKELHEAKDSNARTAWTALLMMACLTLRHLEKQHHDVSPATDSKKF